MKRLFCALAWLTWIACSATAQPLTVAAAANLSALEKPLSEAFSRSYPGRSLQFVFGASGTLATQILHGAPFHVFLSADRVLPQTVADAGLAKGAVTTYAVGRLIFLALRPVDLSQGLGILLDPRVARFANSNPETAPYGRAAVQALTKAGLFDRVKTKQVLGQNVTQALQFVLTATDFGFVHQAALSSPELAPYRVEGRFWFAVDPALYDPIEQGMVVLKPTSDRDAAVLAAFFSTAARQVFLDFGYGLP